MKLAFSLVAIGVSLVFGGCVAQPATESAAPEEDAVTTGKTDAVNADNWTYFTARPDLRKCMSPLCGGYWVKRVNQPKTK